MLLFVAHRSRRPATLSLDRIPSVIFSSPDGAAVFFIDQTNGTTQIHAYHWSTFGSSSPITHTISLSADSVLLSSLAKRSTVYLLALDIANNCIRSFGFEITTKVTEFQFKEQNASQATADQQRTVHNCLIDCHAEVWTRFPVAAAIQHQLTGVPEKRSPKQLLFATDRDFNQFLRHFTGLIRDFEQMTRKPLGDTLRNCIVSAHDKGQLLSVLQDLAGSQFLFGEWLVLFICLIPIHVAITRDNRFLPLKDGVVSSDWEKSLLGAEVGRIVDSISLGWYESIFQSYMVKKVRL